MIRRPDDLGTDIVVASRDMQRAVVQAQQCAARRLPILIIGPTGTGKEVIARYAHRASQRVGEFVDVNAAALPREMVEGLLFGHRRGTFTSAMEHSAGLFEQASGGTLYLDELCSLPFESQAKLLRVLDTQQVRRLGDSVNRAVDVQVIASVQDPVEVLLADGRIRQDLYFRLAVGVIVLPALAQRADDIPPLARHFASRHGRLLTSGAMAALQAHSWPGNVRELQAVIARAVMADERDVLHAGPVRHAIGAQTGGSVAAPRRTQVEEGRRLFELCVALQWDMRKVALELGVSRATGYRLLRRFGLTPLARVAVKAQAAGGTGRAKSGPGLVSQSHEISSGLRFRATSHFSTVLENRRNSLR